MRFVAYVLYLLLIGWHQVVLKDVTSLYGVSINLAGILVLTLALFKKEFPTMWFGFFAGLVTAAGTPAVMGWHALVLASLGVAACHVRERLNMDSLLGKLLLVASGLLVHNVAVILIHQASGFLYLLWSTAIPGAVYSGIIAWVFFLLTEGRITMKNLKAIF